MDVKHFLVKELKDSGKYQLSKQDKKQISKKGIEDFLFSKLASKKFRKWRLPEECAQKTCQAIKIKTSQNKPIEVVFPMGGYKLWRLPTWPEPDWAEFFNISYLIKYLASLAAAYEAGVELKYYMHTFLMEVHDNLTRKEIRAYVDGFEKLIAEFNKYLPKNFKISTWKDSDLYSKEDYLKELQVEFERISKEYEAWPEERKERSLRTSKMNFKWNGEKDLTHLSESEKQEQLKRSVIYESAVMGLSRASNQVKSDDKVLVFTQMTPQFIGIGSCKTSMAKFWVGVGVLEDREKGFYPRVLSLSQWQKIKDKDHQKIEVDFFDLKNFKNVRVYPGLIRF